MNERIISTPFGPESAPIAPVSNEKKIIDSRVLRFSLVYGGICQYTYLRHKQFPENIGTKINDDLFDCYPLLTTVFKAEKFRQSGGNLAVVNLTRNISDQLKYAGHGDSSLMSHFLIQDIVSSKLKDNLDANGNYAINDLKNRNFGYDMINEVMSNMSPDYALDKDSENIFSFANISGNLLENPYFNPRKMI